MTAIPGTDLTTEAARNRAARMLNEHDAALLVALANTVDRYAMMATYNDGLDDAIEQAKNAADRSIYSPQEATAAWDVVDALQVLRSSGTHIEADPDQDDRDGKQISRAAEAEDPTDECD